MNSVYTNFILFYVVTLHIFLLCNCEINKTYIARLALDTVHEIAHLNRKIILNAHNTGHAATSPASARWNKTSE